MAHIIEIIGMQKYAALWELLLRDGLVDDALLHLRPSKLKQHIQTLDPSQLQPSDYLNLAGSPKLMISTQKSPFHVTYTRVGMCTVPFPDDARGFLYLHSPAAEPKAMWEIRFRITDSNCPSSFKSGSDLAYPNETTWAISLGSLHLHNPEYLSLRDLLIRGGLDVDALLGKMGVTKIKRHTSMPLINYSLNQRFRIDFQRTLVRPTFISFSGEEQLECPIPLLFTVGRQPGLSPYTGSAWCRFEAHSSPGSTQPDQLAIRILEIITPVTVSKPDVAHRVPMPQEGKLVMKYAKRGPNDGTTRGASPLTLDPRPWTLNARMTAHPVIQAILRGTNTDLAV
ncbi:hypothetical protein FIBSPDRAFT_943017 [Athelia psychrophila]|uniref:Uncharacterized protein n=1 Tax=Athelia psychrophila TaxID=1759441 RepID=A0A166WMU9_9AGAM|nr:hypothetical protein FIBSPDRAFT_943017 [Fibularhizoctonia sp. CBS 109695]